MGKSGLGLPSPRARFTSVAGLARSGAEAKKRRRESTDSEGMVTSLLLWSLLILRKGPGIAGLLWGVEI
jgi:hypothetical protein